MRFSDPTRAVAALFGAALGWCTLYAVSAVLDGALIESASYRVLAMAAGAWIAYERFRRVPGEARFLIAGLTLWVVPFAHLSGSRWFLMGASGEPSLDRLLAAMSLAVSAFALSSYAGIRTRGRQPSDGDYAARCSALTVAMAVAVGLLAVPRGAVYGAGSSYSLPVSTAPFAILDGDAPYRWVSVPDLRGREAFRTSAHVVSGDAILARAPNGFENASFYLYATGVAASADLRPALREPTLPKRTRAGGAGEIRLGANGARKRISIGVGETRRIFIDAAHAGQVGVSAENGARILVHGVFPARTRKVDAAPRRVVLISLDTHAAQHMSIARSQPIDTSPALRGLAESDPRAVYFSNALAVSYWTLPTHATVFTGLYPSQHGMIRASQATRVADATPWMSETLRDAGVRTFHLFSHSRLADRYGYQRGVDFYRAYETSDLPFGKRARRVLRDAVELLDEARGDDVFMFLHLFDAHAPYDNFPEDHEALGPTREAHYPHRVYEGEAYKRLKAAVASDPKARLDAAATRSGEFGPHMAGALAAYQLGIRDVDDAVADFLRVLRARGLYEDTTLIFFGDHGEEFFSHGLLTHSTLHNENLNVPFLVRLGSNVDVPIDSESVNRHQFEAHTTLHRMVHELFGVGAESPSSTNAVGVAELMSLRSHRRALAEHYAFDPEDPFYEAALHEPDRTKTMVSNNSDFVQVYDLAADELEKANLAQDDKETRSRAERLRRLVAPLREGRAASVSVSLASDEMERLEALGYF